MTMDPGKIATLKRTLVEATDFTDIADIFLEELGNDLAFINSGKRYSDKRFLTDFAQAAAAVSGTPTGVFEGKLKRVAEHRMVHGAFTYGEWTGMMFYFEDLQQGFMALGDETGPSRFSRFSLIPAADGKGITIH